MSRNHSSLRSIALTLLTTCGLPMLACDVEEYDEQDLILADADGQVLFNEEDDLTFIEIEEDNAGTTRSTSVTSTLPPSGAPFNDTVQQGQWRHFSSTKLAGYKYKVCIWPAQKTTNPDLYGNYTGYPDVVGTYQFRSIGLAGVKDCIEFIPKETGPYYISVYGKTWSNYYIEWY